MGDFGCPPTNMEGYKAVAYFVNWCVENADILLHLLY